LHLRSFSVAFLAISRGFSKGNESDSEEKIFSEFFHSLGGRR